MRRQYFYSLRSLFPLPLPRLILSTSHSSADNLFRPFDITGMAIPKGITLIVGGGFHGKSTLLKALEVGGPVSLLYLLSTPLERNTFFFFFQKNSLSFPCFLSRFFGPRLHASFF